MAPFLDTPYSILYYYHVMEIMAFFWVYMDY